MQYRDIQLSAVTFPGIKSALKFTEASKNVRNEVAPYVANACCLTKYTGAGQLCAECTLCTVHQNLTPECTQDTETNSES